MSLFNVHRYPTQSERQYRLDAIAYSEISRDNHLWLEFQRDNKANIMLGFLENYIKSDFKRSHSKFVCNIDFDDTTTHTFESRDYKGNYRIYEKDNTYRIKIYIDIKRILASYITYDGLLLRNADYHYYLGLLKKIKEERGQ